MLYLRYILHLCVAHACRGMRCVAAQVTSAIHTLAPATSVLLTMYR
jgi:hypothetical protein